MRFQLLLPMERYWVIVIFSGIRMTVFWAERGQEVVIGDMMNPMAVRALLLLAAANWWSLEPLHAPKDATIDVLIARSGLKSVRPASNRELIRRVSFDLIGLPPSPSEVDAFVNDPSPKAFETVVDRLLKSPHFGERWARYWLDIARYSEDDVLGLSQESYPNAWRYRDWVIEAYNRDLPYNSFVKAQIAADLMEGDYGMDLRPALGFFGLGPWYYTIAPPPIARADERHDRVDVVTRGFLGLTVACARCHDHKFDPIPTKDYYALAGVFASSEYKEFALAPETETTRYDAHQQKIKDLEKSFKDAVQQLSMQLAESLATKIANKEHLDLATSERWQKYLDKKDREYSFPLDTIASRALEVFAEKKSIDSGNEAAVAATRPKKGAAKTRLPNGYETYDEFCPGCQVEAKALEREKYYLWSDLFKYPGGVLVYKEEDLGPYLAQAEKDRIAKMKAELEQLKKDSPAPYPFLHAIGERAQPVNLKVSLRGDPYNLGEDAPRHFLSVLGGQHFTSGSGRLELAEAIVKTPIAARVAANRIWGNLFGSYLVNSPSNFGKLGSKPSNPDLLEYLAQRLIDNKWSQKSLIREIVLSKTYQLSSESNTENEANDPGNKFYWRANRRRLDAESTRDAILAVSGALDGKIGGPPVDLAKDESRRTIYGKVSRFRLADSLSLFDFPHPSITSEKRNVTLVPLQRLFFLNSEFVESRSAALAGRLKDGSIRDAYRMILGREPNEREAKLGENFLKTADWKQYAQVLLSSNEFSFVD